MTKMPNTKAGKLSVSLNALFLMVTAASLILVEILKVLSFDDSWWDVTAGIIFPASIIALVAGTIAVRRNKEHSILVSLSILTSICVILFLLLHSLFIND